MEMKKLIIILCMGLFSSFVWANSSVGFPNEPFKANLNDKESLRKGAQLFLNNCLGCHSLQYQRYNRIAQDLDIDEETLKKDYIFTDAKVGEQIHSGMSTADGEKWFGVPPPDLSLTARAKTARYIYNYLQGFYYDASRPFGFNNSRFPGASMPNPFWEEQGLQLPKIEEEKVCAKNAEGKEECMVNQHIVGFTEYSPGSVPKAEYQKMVYDVTNFLTYVSDPSAIKRKAMGVWVLLFLFVMTVIFYLLKKEFWRDVH